MPTPARLHDRNRATAPSREVLPESVVAFGETLFDQFADREVLGGAPFNVACHLRALGAAPLLLTRAGKDAQGDRLLREMRARGLDLRGVQRDPTRPTGRVRVEETGDGHRFEILPDQAYDHIHANMARMAGLAAHPALIYFGTLAQRGASAHALHELLDTVDAPAFLDVNLRDPWVDRETLVWSLNHADVVKLNGEELLRLADLLPLDGATPEARARVLLSRYALSRLIVTEGAAGAWSLDRAGRIDRVAGAPLGQVADTVGAGDGFAAVCLLGLLRHWPVARMLQRADALARALCGVRGAVPEHAGFYEVFLRAWRDDRAEQAHA